MIPILLRLFSPVKAVQKSNCYTVILQHYLLSWVFPNCCLNGCSLLSYGYPMGSNSISYRHIADSIFSSPFFRCLKLQEPRQLGAKYFHFLWKNRDISCQCPCQTFRFSSPTRRVLRPLSIYSSRNKQFSHFCDVVQEPFLPQASTHLENTQQEQAAICSSIEQQHALKLATY